MAKSQKSARPLVTGVMACCYDKHSFYVSSWLSLRFNGGTIRSSLIRFPSSGKEVEIRNKAVCALGHAYMGSQQSSPEATAS